MVYVALGYLEIYSTVLIRFTHQLAKKYLSLVRSRFQPYPWKDVLRNKNSHSQRTRTFLWMDIQLDRQQDD